MYLYSKPIKRSNNTKYKKPLFVFTILVVVSIIFIKLFLTFPTVYANTDLKNITLSNYQQMPWPAYGQSAVGIKDYGVLASTEDQQAKPMASVTKIATALAILDKHPIKTGDQGGTITIKDSDKLIYDDYLSRQGVVVDLEPGQSITQYKALQYMLILSANNVADIGANWAFGSVDEYKKYANNMVKKLGLRSINIDDASGFSPNTVSTAEDLVRLGEYALNNPVIADIVAQEDIALPDGTKKISTNAFLNYNGNGVIGIKNGLTDEAGGVLLAGANREIDGKKIVVITAVMGSLKYFDSQKDAIGLIDPTMNLLKAKAEIKAGTTAGFLNVPWFGAIPLVTSKDLKAGSWIDAANKAEINVKPVSSPKNKGEVVGELSIYNNDGTANKTELVIDKDLTKPKAFWRLKNPFNR